MLFLGNFELFIETQKYKRNRIAYKNCGFDAYELTRIVEDR